LKEDEMEIGIIGLGKMGSNIALQAVEKGIRVVGMSRKRRGDLSAGGIEVVMDLKAVKNLLQPSRMIFLWIPAGPGVDQLIDSLVPFLNKGDILIDGGNSHFRDSQVRYGRLKSLGIEFIDCGTNGGIEGARNGACFMIGGDSEIAGQVEPILRKLAVPDGYIHAGKSGAGHFAKLIHNAIEFGMLQSIGEGLAMLKKSDFDLNFAALFHNWAHGSVIRGWLVELMEKGLRDGKPIEEISAYVEDTGEVNWAVEEALRLEVPIPVISQSIMELFKSRDEEKISAKAVGILRHGFGGHPYGKNDAVAKERKTGKVGLSDK
jgi:6-phosphogluconate dehydrogenase